MMDDFDATGKDAAPANPEMVNSGNPQETRMNGIPPQQVYTTPQPQNFAQQPYAPQSRQSQPSGKINRVPFVLAVCFTASMVLQVLLSISGIVYIGGWVTHIIGMLIVGAGVLLIWGIRQRGKTGKMLFGVGLFAIAAGNILSILANSYSYFYYNMIAAIAMLALDVIIPTSLTVSGISYFVSNDSFASIRVIMMLVMIAVIIISTFLYKVFDLLSLLNILTYAALGFCVILFKPVSQAKG